MKRIRLMLADGATHKVTPRFGKPPAAQDFDLVTPADGSEAAQLAVAGDVDAIITYQTPVSGAVIRGAPALKFIQKHGRNCRSIDVAAASERGVRVAVMPLMRNVTVAEHAMSLLLACARKVIDGHRAVTTASYQQQGLEPTVTTQDDYRKNWAGIAGVTELFKSTVGIVGMGDIGMEIAHRCRAFGMTVNYHQRTRHPASVEDLLGISYLPLDDLLSSSDYIVLVIPHTPESEGIINARALARMKPSAVIVNVGRGGLIDEAALVAALENKQIAMAGLDVYRMEPLPVASRLRELPNVVLLPHTGGGSYRSWEIDVPASLANISRFFAGGKADGIINP
jgi:lactate dehydrogenase-like 2-hydroxyacid dehydrogenase